MIIRNALLSDAPSVCSIYNHYIENTIVTFEEENISVEEMAGRIESISKRFPYLVVESDHRLIGYAYATEWKTRSAYRYSAEVTIYLHPLHLGKGTGSMLFSALLDRIKDIGLHSLVGGITIPNEASISLHEKFGFENIARFKEIGFKFGKWIDVGYWELIL